MNFYGTKEYNEMMKKYEERIFPNCDLSSPSKEVALDGEYTIKIYRYVDEENKKPGYSPLCGEICRLYHKDEIVFEWKSVDITLHRIITHSDGNRYLLFNENLYGYSVLNLMTKKCVRYIPYESYLDDDDFEETFIWCDAFYDAENNLLAVEGCFWAAPYSVIVLDFSNPMKIVEADKWIDLWDCAKDNKSDIEFVKWESDKIICNNVTISKEELIRMIEEK